MLLTKVWRFVGCFKVGSSKSYPLTKKLLGKNKGVKWVTR